MKKTTLLLVLLITCFSCSLATACTSGQLHIHNFSYSTLKEATCYSEGKMFGVCSCGESIEKTIPTYGHTEVIDEAVAPTCTQTGLTEGKHCSVCGKVLIAQEVVQARHTEIIDEAVAPTCTQTGLTQGSHCSVCGEVFIAQEIIAAGAHNYVEGNCSSCGVTSIEYFTFYLLSDDTYEVNLKDKNNLPTNIKIPDSYNGKPVTSIGSGAFEYCRSLTSVVIGDSVTSIGNSAFYNCSGLTSVVIPTSVTTICAHAFGYCSSLTSVVIPDSVTSIGENAFYGCRELKEVNYLGTIDEWVQIGFNTYFENPLYYAKQLKINGEVITEVNLTTATLISNYAFYNYSGLTSVVIGDSVTSIGDSAFGECISLTSIKVSENNEYYKDIDGNLYTKDDSVLIQYTIGKSDDSFIIPNCVTAIGDYAFYCCTMLTSVEIPDSVTSIGNLAFYNCSGLTSVVIGDSVTSIGDLAFSGCTSLTSVVIPNSVTEIGSTAFMDCSGLTSVVIGDSVTSIGNSAFWGCSSLTSVVIPDSVTSIGGWAFGDCSGLKNIYYTGTQQQWKSISKGRDWNYNTGSYTITYNYTGE